MKVSVVISARNEFPNIVHTVHSILNDLETFLQPNDYEILIVDNCSDDSDPRHRAISGTVDFLRSRGMYSNRVLKIIYDPIAGNVSARNKGVAVAQGEYVFFSDAHMSYGIGTFKRLMQTIDESGGIVHPAVAWMGSYPPSKGYQYSWKLGEEFKGTWNNYLVGKGDDWFYVPAMGHCCLGMKREQFLKFRGYPDFLRCYGGGEVFLDSKWWMMGSSVVTEPRVSVYHLSASRGYSYVHDDYIHNVFHSALVLGADAWAERTYLNYLRKNRKEVLDRMWKEAWKEAQPQRDFLMENSVMRFDDMLVRRPWDEMNMKKFGGSNSGMLIYHWTELELLKQSSTAKVAYLESKLQQGLGEFIEKNLSGNVYRHNESIKRLGLNNLIQLRKTLL